MAGIGFLGSSGERTDFFGIASYDARQGLLAQAPGRARTFLSIQRQPSRSPTTVLEEIIKEVVGIHALPARPPFGGDIQRS
jgi:hypothetical protein